MSPFEGNVPVTPEEMREWQIRDLERRVKALTQQRDELAERVGNCSNAYHAAQEEAISLRVYVRALEEANDALRSQLPSYENRVELWVRGEVECL